MLLASFAVDSASPRSAQDIDPPDDAQALERFMAQVHSRHQVVPLREIAQFREDLILILQNLLPRRASEGNKSSSPLPDDLMPRPPQLHAVPPYVGNAPFTGRAEDLALLDQWGSSSDPVMVIEAIGGTGKSAISWQWARHRAPAFINNLAGRFWWSFYEGSASMVRFLQELLAYISGHPIRQIKELGASDLTNDVLAALCSRPYLLILDGFERLLTAYHRFDPSKLRDEEVGLDKRSLIEPEAEEVVRRLTAVSPSKVLISSRLMPISLQGRFGQQIPGVQHVQLVGLTDADTRTLLTRLGIVGRQPTIARFFGPLGNHPLLVGVVAGLVRDYRPDPGNFDRWLSDPTAGGALSLHDIDLTQRRNHILSTALSGLHPGPRQLLGTLSVMAGAIDWATLEAINPFRPEPPALVQFDVRQLGNPPDPFAYRRWHMSRSRGDPSPKNVSNAPGWQKWQEAADRLYSETEYKRQKQLAEWRSSEPFVYAKAQLDANLRELEDRGLLSWDRSSNTYDLHPIIRSYTHDRLEDADRIIANDRIRDHFQALPPEDHVHAASVGELSRTITIFRALLGAGHISEADAMWKNFDQTLLVNIGAFGTVVELLCPQAINSTRRMRSDLALAYRFLGQHDEAIGQELDLLTDALQEKNFIAVERNITRISACFRAAGAHATAWRWLDLWESLTAAGPGSTRGEICLHRATLAAIEGRIKRAHELLEEAKGLGPSPQSPWFDEAILLQRVYLALSSGREITDRYLKNRSVRAHSWQSRYGLAELRYEYLIDQKQFGRAFYVAQQYEQLGRDAGLDVAPARSALVLAKLGKKEEASTLIENSLSGLSELHPAERPHRFIALALWELGRRRDAVAHAMEAYRQAWRDGPPYCHRRELNRMRELLETMGSHTPQLPVTDPTLVRVPLEDEIRTFILSLKKA
jgi:tetratricopeptide (TPR) repeat protein